MKLDKFTWIVLIVVALLLIGSVITVMLNNGRGVGTEPTYMEEDSPEAPVHNAFVAFQLGEITMARRQYSAQVLEEVDKQSPYGPLQQETIYDERRTARRLRIVDVAVDADDPDVAYVTYVQDNYNNEGLFGGGSTWSTRRTVQVIREDGRWKLDAMEFFY